MQKQIEQELKPLRRVTDRVSMTKTRSVVIAFLAVGILFLFIGGLGLYLFYQKGKSDEKDILINYLLKERVEDLTLNREIQMIFEKDITDNEKRAEIMFTAFTKMKTLFGPIKEYFVNEDIMQKKIAKDIKLIENILHDKFGFPKEITYNNGLLNTNENDEFKF